MRHLVEIAVWRRTGDSFEFAHFTDARLALAIHRLGGQRARTVADVQETVAKIRADRGNLERALGRGVTKPDLADELWPRLEKRLELALSRGTSTGIPLVRVLRRAHRLAVEFPGDKTAIAIRQ